MKGWACTLIIALEEAKHALEDLKEPLEDLGQALRINEMTEKVAELEAQTLEEGFWNDTAKSSRILQNIKQMKDKIEAYHDLLTRREDALTLAEMAIEEQDESSL